MTECNFLKSSNKSRTSATCTRFALSTCCFARVMSSRSRLNFDSHVSTESAARVEQGLSSRLKGALSFHALGHITRHFCKSEQNTFIVSDSVDNNMG